MNVFLIILVVYVSFGVSVFLITFNKLLKMFQKQAHSKGATIATKKDLFITIIGLFFFTILFSPIILVDYLKGGLK